MKEADRRIKTLDSFLRKKRNGKYECLNCGKELETHKCRMDDVIAGSRSSARAHVRSCLKKMVKL